MTKEIITYDDNEVRLDIHYEKNISTIEAKERAINLIIDNNQIYLKHRLNIKHLYWIIPLSIFIGMLIYAFLSRDQDTKMFNVAMCCMQELYNISVYGGC